MINNIKKNNHYFKASPDDLEKIKKKVQEKYFEFSALFDIETESSSNILLNSESSEIRDENNKPQVTFENLEINSYEDLRSHVVNDLQISCFSEYQRAVKNYNHLPSRPDKVRKFRDQWEDWPTFFGIQKKFTDKQKHDFVMDIHFKDPNVLKLKQKDTVSIEGVKVRIGEWFSGLKYKRGLKELDNDQLGILESIETEIANRSKRGVINV